MDHLDDSNSIVDPSEIREYVSEVKSYFDYYQHEILSIKQLENL